MRRQLDRWPALVVALVIAVLVAACGESQNPVAPTMAGAGAATQSDLGDVRNSCPSDAPGVLGVGSEQGRVDFTWTNVAKAQKYEVQVQQYTVNNVYQADLFLVYDAADRREWYGAERDRKYRARVRRVIGGCEPGDWTAWTEFTVNANPLPPSPPEPPQRHHRKHRRQHGDD